MRSMRPETRSDAAVAEVDRERLGIVRLARRRGATPRPKLSSKCAGVVRVGRAPPRSSSQRLHGLVEAPLLALPEQREARRAAGDEAVRAPPPPSRAAARGAAALSLDRQLAPVAALAQERLGDAVEEIAALERLDAPPLLGLGRGLQPEHVLQQILEAAARVGGEPARGDGVARLRAGRAAAASLADLVERRGRRSA